MTQTEKKVAIITGGTTGIGKEVAYQFAKLGVRIVLVGRDKERGQMIAAELQHAGASVGFVQTDVGREIDVKNMVEHTLNLYGRVDYLFNNAGTEGILGPLETNTEEIIDEVLSSNVKGVVLCIKHVLPVMIKQESGCIINTASFVGTTLPLAGAIVYGASKAAVISITRSAALVCAEQPVHIFAVCPWVTDTPMVDRLTGHQEDAKAAFGANINPNGKIATVADIAGAALNIFIGKTTLTTGDAVLVDSGGTVKRINPMVAEQ